jgi:putative oxidoreductase
LRLIVGYGFIAHGYAKVMNGPDRFAASLHGLGVPASHAMAWMTIVLELLGGLAVLVGAWIPLVTVPLSVILLVAAITVHVPYGFSSIKLREVTPAGPQFGPPGYETDLLYLAALAALVLGGSGRSRSTDCGADTPDTHQATRTNERSRRPEYSAEARVFLTFEENVMFRVRVFGATVACFAVAAATTVFHASGHGRTLVVTMTNDQNANQLEVYDAESHALLQTLSTHGKGGVGGNARGIKQHDGRLVAVVNNGSGTVALFRRDGDVLRFDKVIPTTSAPVSVDFGNDHLYVAGATTVDSFVLRESSVEWLDGTAGLALVGGGIPQAGSTAQVGVIDGEQLLVTLKTDPDPGTVDVIALLRGRITGSAPTAVSAPDGTLAPFGFATYPDGTALITLAHSNQDGLFRDGSFTSVVAAGQTASCWMTRAGKYVFVANTGSGSISRIVGTGSNVFIDANVAAQIPTGAPADIDADAGVLGVIDHGAGQSHLTVFTYDRFGDLAPAGGTITIGVPDANGVAILSPRADDRNQGQR